MMIDLVIPIVLSAMLTYALKVNGEGTEIWINYPSGGEVIELCLDAWDTETSFKLDTRCYTPKHSSGEPFFWENMDFVNLSALVARAKQVLPDGTIKNHEAWPFEYVNP